LVFFQIDAKDEFEAVRKAIGERAVCEFPRHSFVIHAEDIIGWQPTELVEREARRPPAYVPPPPSEKIYYIEPKERMEKLRRKEWWKT